MSIFDRLRQQFDPSPGRLGERVAARYLRKTGYRILKRNWRHAMGEIDLIVLAPDRRTIVIVEVKTRVAVDGDVDPRPEVHVNSAKQRKLATLASAFVQRHRLGERPVRFDVVGVDLPPDRHDQPIVRHHEAAFESYL